MARRSKIDQKGLGDKIRSYAIAGLSNREILSKLAREHPEAGINRENLSKFLSTCDLVPPEDQAQLALASRELVDTTLRSIESVRDLLESTLHEIERAIADYRDDPRGLAVFLKLKLDALGQIGRIVATIQPEPVRFVTPGPSDPRCDGCPHKGRLTWSELRAGLED